MKIALYMSLNLMIMMTLLQLFSHIVLASNEMNSDIYNI